MQKRYQLLVVKVSRLVDRTTRQGWRWGYDPRRRCCCLFTPDHRCYDFHARPGLTVQAHKQVNGQLI